MAAVSKWLKTIVHLLPVTFTKPAADSSSLLVNMFDNVATLSLNTKIFSYNPILQLNTHTRTQIHAHTECVL